MELELPYPPTTNKYYRNVNGRTLISASGRAYRREVAFIVLSEHAGMKPLRGDIKATIRLYPPDKRRRDLDNTLKCMLDSLQKAGVMKDDSQIKHIDAMMMDRVGEGSAMVTLEEIN